MTQKHLIRSPQAKKSRFCCHQAPFTILYTWVPIILPCNNKYYYGLKLDQPWGTSEHGELAKVTSSFESGNCFTLSPDWWSRAQECFGLKTHNIPGRKTTHPKVWLFTGRQHKWCLKAPEPTFFGSGGCYGLVEVGNGLKQTKQATVLCSCRQPLAEICDFSRPLKSANLDLLDFQRKNKCQ